MSFDSVLKTMTVEEKVYQMFILGFDGYELSKDNKNIQNLVEKGLGGVILFADNIKSYSQTKNLVKALQNKTKIPLFISIDQEGGVVERTKNIPEKINYLSPAELSRVGKEEVVKAQFCTMAKELEYIGVNMNFAPVLDVNTCSDNPIIGNRSFGDNPDIVIKFSSIVTETLASQGIVPVVKHFPGHGNTTVDSHIDLPIENLSFEEMEKVHIKPFKESIKKGIDAIMIAHVFYKCFDSEKIPASLSENVIGYLRNSLGFGGVTISDDMIMGGVAKHYDPVDACICGIQSGIDLFIYRNSTDFELNIINEVVKAVKNGVIQESLIDESVQRIMHLKNKYGLPNAKKCNDFDAVNYNKHLQEILNLKPPV